MNESFTNESDVVDGDVCNSTALRLIVQVAFECEKERRAHACHMSRGQLPALATRLVFEAKNARSLKVNVRVDLNNAGPFT